MLLVLKRFPISRKRLIDQNSLRKQEVLAHLPIKTDRQMREVALVAMVGTTQSPTLPPRNKKCGPENDGITGFKGEAIHHGLIPRYPACLLMVTGLCIKIQKLADPGLAIDPYAVAWQSNPLNSIGHHSGRRYRYAQTGWRALAGIILMA